MASEDYSRLSLLEKTNLLLDIVEFDAKQCAIASIDELKITAPIVVVKIFEKVIGMCLDNEINELAFDFNADVVLRTLQKKYGLNQHITPSLLVQGDLMVIEQIMDILYKLAIENKKCSDTIDTGGGHTHRSFTKEDEETKKRVFNISARFNTNFAHSLTDELNQSQHFEEWQSTRDRDELVQLQTLREEKLQKSNAKQKQLKKKHEHKRQEQKRLQQEQERQRQQEQREKQACSDHDHQRQLKDQQKLERERRRKELQDQIIWQQQQQQQQHQQEKQHRERELEIKQQELQYKQQQQQQQQQEKQEKQEKQRQLLLQRERDIQLQQQHDRELQQQRDNEMQQQRDRALQQSRDRAMKLQKDKEIQEEIDSKRRELQLQLDRERQQQREAERKQQHDKEIQLRLDQQLEAQRVLEIQQQYEREEQFRRDVEAQQQLDSQRRELEWQLDRNREQLRQREIQLQHDKELEKQREAELQQLRDRELHQLRERATQQQRDKDLQELIEQKRAELQHQLDSELQQQRERELLQTRNQNVLCEIDRELQLLLDREKQLQLDRERQLQHDRGVEQQLESERQRLQSQLIQQHSSRNMSNFRDELVGGSSRSGNNSIDEESETTEESGQWRGWQDDGQRQRTAPVPEDDEVADSSRGVHSSSLQKSKGVYCYDTFSGYRVNPRLLAELIQKNNPPALAQTLPLAFGSPGYQPVTPSTLPSSFNKVSSLSPSRHTPRGTKHLDRTVYVGAATHLHCYKELEPLDLLLTVEHSWKTNGGSHFKTEKEREISKHHTKVADHVFRCIVNMTHSIIKPHVRFRILRLNAQSQRKKFDVENKEFSNHLEIQIAFMNNKGKVHSNLLFSRHKTRQWPSMKVLDKRIGAFYSRINMQLHHSIAIDAGSVSGSGGDDVEKNMMADDTYPFLDNDDYIKVSKKQKSPEIIDLFDARYLYCVEDVDAHHVAR